MSLKFAKKRSVAIEQLTDNAADSALQMGDKKLYAYLCDLMRDGIVGYKKYTNDELRDELNGTMDPWPKIDVVIDD